MAFSKDLNPRALSKDCIIDLMTKQKSIVKDGHYEFENYGTLSNIIETYSLGVYACISEITFIETTSAIGNDLTNEYIQFILDKKEKGKNKFKGGVTYIGL
ncbi:hypothetical protein BH10BAC3_BH10BAC3_07930 [soil metagenome]